MEQRQLPQLAISVTPEEKHHIKTLPLSHNLTLGKFTMLTIERFETELQLNPNLAQLGNTFIRLQIAKVIYLRPLYGHLYKQ
ncbi:hypothetical protein [Dapis sp. BLCC M229]|uniref:hypothetical protein n=1 Tax=Dapis sp. BLCC M229 TaxID=3400188 RepID=UPI003CE7EC1A